MIPLVIALAAGALHPPGRLLVEAPPYGLAIVEPSGAITRLGKYYDAAWSPDGTRIAAANGRRLVVLDDSGRVLWSRRGDQPAEPDWTSDGKLLAYRDGTVIHTVRADGHRDRRVAQAERLRWRPGTHQLAVATRNGVIRIAGRQASQPGNRIRPYGLVWSADGRTLAAISGSYVRILRGRQRRTITTHGFDHFQSGTYAGNALVLVRHDFTRGTSHVTRAGRTVFSGRGTVSDVTASPDGSRLLLGRRSRDEWQLWPASPSLNHVTRAINPDATGAWAFPRTRAWR